MKDYNGYTAAQRSKSMDWLRAQWEVGAVKRPFKCCACGQDKGIIDAHAEDYSEPFEAGKTDQYPLCYRCHMMVHCRFRNKDKWEWYRLQIKNGVRFKPFYSRNFPIFLDEMIKTGNPPIESENNTGLVILYLFD